MIAVTGMAQRKRVAMAELVAVEGTEGADARRTPSVRTVTLSGSKPTTTVPSRSVRSTRAPAFVSRSRVSRVGCPYGFPAPADATAILGRTASTKPWVVAVRLP